MIGVGNKKSGKGTQGWVDREGPAAEVISSFTDPCWTSISVFKIGTSLNQHVHENYQSPASSRFSYESEYEQHDQGFPPHRVASRLILRKSALKTARRQGGTSRFGQIYRELLFSELSTMSYEGREHMARRPGDFLRTLDFPSLLRKLSPDFEHRQLAGT